MGTDTGASDLVHPERCRAKVRSSRIDRLGNRLAWSEGEEGGIYETASCHSGSSCIAQGFRIRNGSRISAQALRSHKEERSTLSLLHEHRLSTTENGTVYCESDILNIDSKRYWTNQRDTGNAIVTNIRSEDCGSVRPSSRSVKRNNSGTAPAYTCYALRHSKGTACKSVLSYWATDTHVDD